MKTKLKMIIASMVATLSVAILAISASANSFDASSVFTTAALSGLLDTLWAIVPIVLPIVVVLIGFRIGWNFFRGQLK
jgi:hypothetical protein